MRRILWRHQRVVSGVLKQSKAARIGKEDAPSIRLRILRVCPDAVLKDLQVQRITPPFPWDLNVDLLITVVECDAEDGGRKKVDPHTDSIKVVRQRTGCV